MSAISNKYNLIPINEDAYKTNSILETISKQLYFTNKMLVCLFGFLIIKPFFITEYFSKNPIRIVWLKDN